MRRAPHQTPLTSIAALSVIIMTKNEAANVGECVASVAWTDEVFVVDSGSVDETKAIALASGAKVVNFVWNGRYPKKKQWCLENLPLRNDWVLYLDADERVTPELAREIAWVLASPGAPNGYTIGLDYVWEGRVLRHGDRAQKLALFNRHLGRFAEWPDLDVENMWEVEGHYQPVVEGQTGRLKSAIRHDDHDELFDWFARHNRYSDWEARLRQRGSNQAPRETQLGARGIAKRLFPHMPARPLFYFVYSVVLSAGWRDGRAGLSFALAKAFYQWQIDIKQREIQRKGLSRSRSAS